MSCEIQLHLENSILIFIIMQSLLSLEPQRLRPCKPWSFHLCKLESVYQNGSSCRLYF